MKRPGSIAHRMSSHRLAMQALSSVVDHDRGDCSERAQIWARPPSIPEPRGLRRPLASASVRTPSLETVAHHAFLGQRPPDCRPPRRPRQPRPGATAPLARSLLSCSGGFLLRLPARQPAGHPPPCLCLAGCSPPKFLAAVCRGAKTWPPPPFPPFSGFSAGTRSGTWENFSQVFPARPVPRSRPRPRPRPRPAHASHCRPRRHGASRAAPRPGTGRCPGPLAHAAPGSAPSLAPRLRGAAASPS